MMAKENKPENDLANFGHPVLFREGNWALIKETIDGVENVLVHHLCRSLKKDPARGKSHFSSNDITYLDFRNSSLEQCYRCSKLVPDSIKTLWVLLNFNKLSKE